MKNIKRIGALIITLALLATSLMTGGIVSSAEVVMPTTDTTVNAVGSWNDWYNAGYVMAFEQSGVTYIDAGNGIARPGADEVSVVYRTEKNSPFVAEFLIYRDNTKANPIFLVSADGVTYTDLAMNNVVAEDNINKVTYYTDAIGENNKYVKIIVSDTAGSHWMCDMRTVSYNANTEAQETLDTTCDYTNWGTWEAAAAGTFDMVNTSLAIDAGCGFIGSNGMDTYSVYRVKENSAISAVLNQFNGHTPAFYASPDGINWTKITTQQTPSGNSVTHYRDCIGIGNKYVKVVYSTQEGASWQADLRSFSYNANTEAQETLDTTLDYTGWGTYEPAVIGTFELVNLGQAFDAGCGFIGSNGMNTYAVYRVKENSAIAATIKQVNGHTPAFFVSPDGINWIQIAVKATVDGQIYYYYRDCIGAGNKYVKLVLSTQEGASWQADLKSFSFNANTDVASFDTTLDFVGDYNNALAKSTANEGLFGATGQNGLTAANGPIASVVFEVEKNSAISADFLYFADNAVSKPLFFASANGVDWTPITMQMTANGNGRTYYRDCIGVDNRYVKIQINDVTEPVFWANDLRSFSYNLVDPSGDGKITADDIVVVQKQLLGVESGKNIDLNRDTLGNVKDLIRIKKILADKA